MEPMQSGALKIYPFGMIFAALLALFFAGTAYRIKKNGMKQETASWFAVLAVPICFVLSRLGFCLLSIDQILGAQDYGMLFRVTEGGFLLWGALAGILLTAKITGKITNQSGAKIAERFRRILERKHRFVNRSRDDGEFGCESGSSNRFAFRLRRHGDCGLFPAFEHRIRAVNGLR